MKKLVAVLCAMNVALMIGWTYDRSYHEAHQTRSNKSDMTNISNKKTVVDGDLLVNGSIIVSNVNARSVGKTVITNDGIDVTSPKAWLSIGNKDSVLFQVSSRYGDVYVKEWSPYSR